MLTDTSSGGWGVTAGKRGTIEFDTPSAGDYAARPASRRDSCGYTITTIPVMAR